MKALIRLVFTVLFGFSGSGLIADDGWQVAAGFNSAHYAIDARYNGWMVAGRNDTIPSDFPTFEIRVSDTPAPGRLFMCPISRNTPRFTYLTILNESILPVYYSKRLGSMNDFKLQPNGLLSFFDRGTGCFYTMNYSYTIVDSFRCGNGYTTDGHDFQMLPNGHALLMSYDQRIIDMSLIVPGGHPAATVIGVAILELDQNKQVVFEWTSWDHFAITDATHEDLTAPTIDYVHANAFELDTDGNILLSSRNMDEITKISRTTGDIIWRLGGLNNQFTFINDTIGFSHQHDIRRLPNGNITLFDNGNFHSPPFSRAVEYRINEQLRTAELVWEFRNTPSIYAFATGNAQRLPNGNTLISWGTENIITEVRPDGSKALELVLSPLFTGYRTFRFPWSPTDVQELPQLPELARLLPAYPNPFNPATTISYELQEVSHINLSVFDVLGNVVGTLVDKVEAPGRKSVRLDARNLASGVYFYRLRAGDVVQTKKLLLLR